MTVRTQNILIAALGGEGGGVLADWIVTAATIAGYPIQSTSIPGVAQRTGATTYYLELYPQKAGELRGAQPIMALTPAPGDVDVIIASELLEAGRAIQNGFVTPQRTTLIASTNRVYSIAERSDMADGRFDAECIMAAAEELAQRAILFDGAALAQESGSPINAILFGALIASHALPFDRVAAEEAIRRAGKAAESNLRGFAIGFERAATHSAKRPAASAMPSAQPLLDFDNLPDSVSEIIIRGVERVADYQGQSYARLYLERLRPIINCERDAGGDCPVSRETARYLALWMSYEDVIRVADLKTRAGRRGRIRNEVRAKSGDIVRVVDFLKPGVEEVCSILPPALGDALHRLARRRGWDRRFNVGMHIQSTSVSGFILLRVLSALRWWRPYSWRYQQEQARIERWLDAIRTAVLRDHALAAEIAECGQIMKGYGDTHARAKHNFDLIADRYFTDQVTAPAVLAAAVNAARRAALADPEGVALATLIAGQVQKLAAAE